MPTYSPERRTAVVLSGTGVHGAYHAGVLRALQEAGVKVDLLGGHGAGAANAALAAIDGQARLWDPDGLWLGPHAAVFYRWTTPVRIVGWLAVVLAGLLVLPFVIVVGMGLVVYLLGFLLDTFGLGAGEAIVGDYTAWLQRAFADDAVPAVVPRLGMIVVAVLGGVLVATATRSAWRGRLRRTRGAPWWRVLSAPIDAGGIQRTLTTILWQLLRGAGAATEPTVDALGRRYVEVLAESLGQPGFRELIVAATDVDGRRDVVGALLKEPFAHDFLAARPDRDRHADVLDFSGAGREQVLGLVAAALTPPVAADPCPVTFAADSHWRGETHRLCDRPGIIHRLLEEVALAGVTQVIVVSACADVAEPHHLQVSRLDPRHRMGEFLVAAESAALRDALDTARLRFDAVYVIRPAHNPLGPFDAVGVYDHASDRHVDVAELVRCGHDDASRQFIEPVVGASGERLARAPIAHTNGHASDGQRPDPPSAAEGLAPSDPVSRRRALAERAFGDVD